MYDSDTMDDIKQAIDQRYMLRISYGGEERTVEPYTYGVTSTGKEALRCFQVEGGSASGNEEGWKLFSIDKIDSIVILGKKFEIHDQYRMNDKVMREIYSQVQL